MARPPQHRFDMLRACFWLIAGMVGTVMLVMVGSVAACITGVAVEKLDPGHCVETGVRREFCRQRFMRRHGDRRPADIHFGA